MEKEEKRERKVEEEQRGESQDKDEEAVEVEEDDNMEWELRNTDSVFSELSELSRDYVESVDRGASVRGKFIKENTMYRPFSQTWLMYFFFIVTRGLINGHKTLTAQELDAYHFLTLDQKMMHSSDSRNKCISQKLRQCCAVCSVDQKTE